MNGRYDDTMIGTLFNEISTRDLARHNVAMTAEQLYDVWLESMEAQNIQCDEWEDLTDADKVAWEAVAAKVKRDSQQRGGKL